MNILFVCTGNTCRSCMAEGIANKIAKELGGEYDINSAGLYAVSGDCASQNAIMAMKDMGIDVSAHYASHLQIDAIEAADIIVTMTGAHKATVLSNFENAKGKVFTLLEYINEVGDIDDPFGGDINTYKSCAKQLNLAIEKLFEKVKGV